MIRLDVIDQMFRIRWRGLNVMNTESEKALRSNPAMRDQSRQGSDLTRSPLPCIDARTLLSVCGGDPRLLAKMIQSFHCHCASTLDELRDAVQDGDMERMQRSAHKLRGLVCAFSTAASDAVRSMEELAARGQLYDADEHYSHLIRIMSALSESLMCLDVPALMQLAAGEPITAGLNAVFGPN
jgi:hypothetical protein